MWSPVRRHINGLILGTLVLGQIVLVGEQVRNASGEPLLRKWVASLLLPFQHGTQAASHAVGESLDRYLWLVGTEAKNRELNALAARVQLENQSLRRQLLRFQSRSEMDAYGASLASAFLPASVIAWGPSRLAKKVYIDRGGADGLRVGMGVISPDGIVGKIEAVHASTSLVMLISDSMAGAGVVLARTGEPGVLRGTDGALCRIDYLRPSVKVAHGDIVLTSGLDGIYPRGLSVGRVTTVEAESGAPKVHVRPSAQLDRLSEVVVILENDRFTLPDSVQQSLAQADRMGEQPDRPALGAPQAVTADLIKQASRRAQDQLARQANEGPHSAGTNPPEESLFASGSTGTDPEEEAR